MLFKNMLLQSTFWLFLLSAFLYGGESYRLILIGDLHFDAAPKVYHHDHLQESKVHLGEFKRNAEMWKERMPRLLAAAAELETPNTALVVQLGDLVQGDCNNPEVHERYMKDALQILTSHFHHPVVVVTGNHDIRGPGAQKVAEKVLASHNASALEMPITNGNFSFVKNGDSFLFLDFNKPSVKLSLKAPTGRYNFLFTHGPGIADDTRISRFRLFGQDSLSLRKTMLDFYFKRDSVIFAGHTHRFVYHRLKKDDHRIDQVIVNSIWSNPKSKDFNIRYDKVEDYGKNLAQEEVTTEEEKKDQARQIKGLKLYVPYLVEYLVAATAGFASVDVSDSGIVFTFYGGDDATKPIKVLRLR